MCSIDGLDSSPRGALLLKNPHPTGLAGSVCRSQVADCRLYFSRQLATNKYTRQLMQIRPESLAWPSSTWRIRPAASLTCAGWRNQDASQLAHFIDHSCYTMRAMNKSRCLFSEPSDPLLTYCCDGCQRVNERFLDRTGSTSLPILLLT